MQPVLCYPSASSNNFPLPFIKQKMNIQTNKKKHKKKPTYRSSPTAHSPCFFFFPIDPQLANPHKCFVKDVLPKLQPLPHTHSAHQEKLSPQPCTLPFCFRARTKPHSSPGPRTSSDSAARLLPGYMTSRTSPGLWHSLRAEG